MSCVFVIICGVREIKKNNAWLKTKMTFLKRKVTFQFLLFLMILLKCHHTRSHHSSLVWRLKGKIRLRFGTIREQERERERERRKSVSCLMNVVYWTNICYGKLIIYGKPMSFHITATSCCSLVIRVLCCKSQGPQFNSQARICIAHLALFAD